MADSGYHFETVSVLAYDPGISCRISVLKISCSKNPPWTPHSLLPHPLCLSSCYQTDRNIVDIILPLGWGCICSPSIKSPNSPPYVIACHHLLQIFNIMHKAMQFLKYRGINKTSQYYVLWLNKKYSLANWQFIKSTFLSSFSVCPMKRQPQQREESTRQLYRVKSKACSTSLFSVL